MKLSGPQTLCRVNRHPTNGRFYVRVQRLNQQHIEEILKRKSKIVNIDLHG
jgi:hypothetical protein